MNSLNQRAETCKLSHPFLVAQQTLSYGEQWQRIFALQNWCIEQSLVHGSRILVAIADELEQVSLLLGLTCCGRVPVIVNPDSTYAEISILLAGCDFDAMIASPELYQAWGLEQYPCPWLKVSKTVGYKGIFSRLLDKRRGAQENSDWPGIVKQYTGWKEHRLEEWGSDTLAYLIFTSGTTSTPKGVEITHSALLAQMDVLHTQYQLNESCRLLNSLPLHHADALLQGTFLAWFSGGTVYRTPFAVQTLQAYMDSIYRYRITHLIAVPTMLSIMLRFGQEWRENFASPDFCFIVSCAGHLEEQLWKNIETQFNVSIVNMYGLSETGTSAFFSGPDDKSHRVGTLGYAVNCTYCVTDDKGTQVSKGEVGELWISSNQLMRGYHNDPVGTSDVLQNGWLKTGDLVRELESGHLMLVGRKKNLIISGGRNVSPEEISSVLMQHPNVIESVVLGQSDPDWGEKVVSLVVTDGGNISATELTDWCRERLAEYKIPKKIWFVEQFSKGPSGKIRLEEARRLLNKKLDEAANHVAYKGQNLEQQIRNIAAETFRLNIYDLPANATPQNTQGWDSLAHMSLVVALELAFNIRLSTREIMQLDSLEKVKVILENKLG